MTDCELDKVQDASEVDVDDPIAWFEQLAGRLVEAVLEVVVLFRHARVGNGDVDALDLLVGGLEVGPRRRVAPDEGCPRGDHVVVRRREVEDEGFGSL